MILLLIQIFSRRVQKSRSKITIKSRRKKTGVYGARTRNLRRDRAAL